MIDPTNFSLFFVASWALILAPGPDMLYVITRGISQGRKAGLLSAFGVTLGILVHTTFAAFGLAILLQTSALAFLVVKYIGALYLVYLGVKALKDKLFGRFPLFQRIRAGSVFDFLQWLVPG